MTDYDFKEAWILFIILLLLAGAFLGWGAVWLFHHVRIEVAL